MKVLQFNVHMGGGFSFVKNIIMHSDGTVDMDIGALNQLEDIRNVDILKNYNTNIFFLSKECNKIVKRFVRLKKLVCLLKTQKYDCIHIHADISSICFYYGIAAKICGVKKIVFHSHSTGVSGDDELLRKLFHFLCRPFLKYIGTDFLACSLSAAKWMFRNVETVKIIKNGIDLNKFKYDSNLREQYRKLVGFTSNDKVIGHVGRFSDEKNHKFIIELLLALRKECDEYKLLLLGDGVLKHEIEALAKEKKLDESIVFTGVVDNVQDYMCAMDLFILPSKFEGLGMVAIEAQSCSLPVIASYGVPIDAKITENVEFANVCDISKWVDCVKNMISLPKQNNTEAVRAAGYDIEKTAEEIKQIYLSN